MGLIGGGGVLKMLGANLSFGEGAPPRKPPEVCRVGWSLESYSLRCVNVHNMLNIGMLTGAIGNKFIAKHITSTVSFFL